MKTILICPEHRAASTSCHRMKPLALMPILGRSLIAMHLQAIASRGVTEVLILVSDRPEMIREAVGNGSAWGLSIEVSATRYELTADDATQLYGGRYKCEIIVADHLPGETEPLWTSHETTFTKIAGLISQPFHADSLTMNEVMPDVWISTRARVATGATITGPAWIGPGARIGKGAVLGPNAIVEGHAYIDEHVSLSNTWVGPSTYVGPAMNLDSSFVWGQTITSWRDGTVLELPDEFVLNDLDQAARKPHISFIERVLALILMAITSPWALAIMAIGWLRDLDVIEEQYVILPPLKRVNAYSRTHVLRQINTSHALLRRWLELWQVVAGKLALVGNRPLTLKEASGLRGEIGQLWLSVPAGVFSLAESEGDERADLTTNIAHAAYFATHRSLRLRAKILARCSLFFLQPNTPP